MKFFRQCGHVLMTASQAHAQWEMGLTRTILGSKRRLIVLALLVLPIFLIGYAFAEDIAQVGPDILGGKKAYSPAFYTLTIFLASILIGLCAGLITGSIGAGGGFIIAPALMSAGIKGILAGGPICFIFSPRRSWAASSTASWATSRCRWPSHSSSGPSAGRRAAG